MKPWGTRTNQNQRIWFRIFLIRLICKKLVLKELLVKNWDFRECSQPRFFELMIFLMFICFKISHRILLNYCDTLGSLVFKLLGKLWKKLKLYDFAAATVQKLKEILMSSLRHWKDQSLIFQNSTFKKLLGPSSSLQSSRKIRSAFKPTWTTKG